MRTGDRDGWGGTLRAPAMGMISDRENSIVTLALSRSRPSFLKDVPPRRHEAQAIPPR